MTARGVEVVRGEGYDEDDLTRGMEGCVARVQRRRRQLAVRRRPAPDGAGERRRRRSPRSARRPAPASPGSSTPPRPRRSASRRARSAPSARRTAAGTCRPTSGPRPRASAPRSPPRARSARTSCCVNPVLGPGSRPRRRHRPLPARVPRRPAAGVRAHLRQPRRHRRLRRRATCSRPSAASPASATCVNGITLRSPRRCRWRPRSPASSAKPRLLPRRVATVAARRGRARLQARRPPAAGVPRDGPHAAPRPPLRRLTGRARARPALHRPARDAPEDRRLGAGGGSDPLSGSPPPARPTCAVRPIHAAGFVVPRRIFQVRQHPRYMPSGRIGLGIRCRRRVWSRSPRHQPRWQRARPPRPPLPRRTRRVAVASASSSSPR